MDDKKVSKTISYWLRHAPEKAGLELDEYGWTSTEVLVNALKARSLITNAGELQSLSKRMEKVRWEFSEDGARIRATHGHSVAVALDDAKLRTPPTSLYHGTPVSAVKSILHEGLRPMSRKAVHLAATPAAALLVGRRRGPSILLEIDAKGMQDAGHNFYETSEGVWLTETVATMHLSLMPWRRVDESTAKIFEEELAKELAPSHVLYPRKELLRAVWRLDGSDDILFEGTQSGEYFVVHLTWSGAVEDDPTWPSFERYVSFNDWLTRRVIPDQAAFFPRLP